jgi:multiple sugar transport system ATP-binding protein
MTIGDSVAVMRRSELQQLADPQTVYDRPTNLFVAGFIGSPPMNMLQADLEASASGLTIAVGDQRLVVDRAELAAHPGLEARAGGRVVVGIRPERLTPGGTGDGMRALRGRVALCEALGPDSLAHVVVPGSTALSDDQVSLAHDVDEAVEIEELARDSTATVIARFDPRAGVREDDELELGVPPGSMLFYDPESGVAIRPTT